MSPHSVDKQLIAFSFDDLFEIILNETEVLRLNHPIDIEASRAPLALIEMFIVLCNKLMRSRTVDKDDKLVVKERRRIARAIYVHIYHFMEREPRFWWRDAPIPKTHSRRLAAEWKQAGLVESIEDIYEELSPEQKLVLEKARVRWNKQFEDYIPAYSWSKAPLFGEPPK